MEEIRTEATFNGARPVLIVNTRSRRGGRYFRAAQAELSRAGIKLAKCYGVESEGQMAKAAAESLVDGSRLLIVGGGDGTISSMADLLAGTGAALGLLPLGTGNDFARALGLPTDLHGACWALRDGVPMEVPLARLDDRYYTNMVLIGRPAHVNHSVPNWLKRLTGTLAYPLSAFFAALHAEPFQASISAGPLRAELATTLVAVGNGRFRGDLVKELGPEPRRHLLVVYAPRDPRRGTLLQLGLYAALKRRPPARLLLTLAGEHLTIDTDPEQEIDVDGVYHGRTPAKIDLVPAAIRVIVPRGAEASRRDRQAAAA